MKYDRSNKKFPVSWEEWDQCQKYELDSWGHHLDDPYVDETHDTRLVGWLVNVIYDTRSA